VLGHRHQIHQNDGGLCLSCRRHRSLFVEVDWLVAAEPPDNRTRAGNFAGCRMAETALAQSYCAFLSGLELAPISTGQLGLTERA